MDFYRSKLDTSFVIMKKYLFLFVVLFLLSCKSDDSDVPTTPDGSMYFPPLTGNTWQSFSPSSLGWNTNHVQPLLDYLDSKNTKGFIILKDGNIVIEQYFNGHSKFANWTWYSASKSLTSVAVGIAQDEGFLDINNKTSDYLGANWSSLTRDKQDLISVKHHLTMTSGLMNMQSNFLDWICTPPSCMKYQADAGTVWGYHQGAFIQVQNILSQSTGMNFKPFIRAKILDKIGMQGSWSSLSYLNLFSSSTRSMARFGLLALNNGVWNGNTIVSNSYFNAMVTTSQNLNKSYGYLWWLNGKESFIGTDSQVFSGAIIPNAPNDMFAALGAKDQKIYVVPSKNIVVIRMGDAAGGDSLGLSSFDNELWAKINLVID